jgi:hypothetical protein
MLNTQRHAFGVFACSAGISGGRNNTEHRKTPSFCVQWACMVAETTLSMKRHQHGCLFVFGMGWWM